ncbi:MAG: flagellar FliJ family protein [Fimbriimonadaceae bacterium]|nr:flagellar FliJ family protein [Fimbriimonadaceae bacterium]
MARFRFRLQRVLDLREGEEAQAKREFLKRRAIRLEAEAQIETMQAQLAAALRRPAESLDQMIQREAERMRREDGIRQARVAVTILENEELAAERNWRQARQAAEGFRMLRDRAKTEWTKLMEKREQDELDEWAVTRRAA